MTVENLKQFISIRNKDFDTPPAKLATKVGFNYDELGKPTESKQNGVLTFTWNTPFGTLMQQKGKLTLLITKNKLKKMEGTNVVAAEVQGAPAVDWALNVPIESLKVEKGFNVRKDLGDIDQLKRSILAAGLLQPLTVRPAANGKDYYIVSGHRRFEALKQINVENDNCFPEVGVIFEDPTTTDVERTISLLLDNDGKALSVLEQGEVYQRLEKLGLGTAAMAKKSGYTAEHIRNCIKLAKAPEEIKEAVRTGEIKGTTGIRIVKNEKDPVKQVQKLADAKASVKGKTNAKGKAKTVTAKSVEPKKDAPAGGVKERVQEIQLGLVITQTAAKFSEKRVWEILNYCLTGKLEKQFKSVEQMIF